MGIDTFKWKRFTFAVSAVFAAVAGGFQGHYIGLLSPTPMKFNEMAMVVIMVIVGGVRTFAGPIVVARGYPAGLVGLCQAAARYLAWRVPALAPRQLELGAQRLVERQELGAVGTGAGQVTHVGEQHAAIHVSPRQVGTDG
jgi:hypothetical protein